MKKVLRNFVIVLLILTMVMGSVASADTLPYVTYNFDYWNDAVITPAAYVPDGSINGDSLQLGHKLGSIYDLYTDETLGIIALCDNTFNAIYILDTDDYSLLYVIDEFFNTETGNMDTFKSPQGVYISNVSKIESTEEESYAVTDSYKQLFICDTENQRLLYFDIDGENKKNLTFTHDGTLTSQSLVSDILGESYTFKPKKVCVDSADRIYVINEGEFQGILQLEKNGVFNGYFGTITVNISLWQKIWRTLSTSAQRSKQTLFIPTEYKGIDIDDAGFLYACYLDQTGTQAVMRLNSKGGNVIKKGANNNLGGDLIGVNLGGNKYSGYNKIVDVTYNGKGMYSLIDNLRGRIFTYDAEGNLLYIFGGLGNAEGTFLSPQAIEINGAQRLVCDVNKNEVQIFSPTQYGRLINEAVGYRYDGDESKAVATWQKVLQLNENFEQAYIGIGKAYLNSGEYKQAMDYLKLGMSRSYYSIAYKRYRNNILKEHFNIIFGTIIVLLVLFIGSRLYKKHKNRKYDD